MRLFVYWNPNKGFYGGNIKSSPIPARLMATSYLKIFRREVGKMVPGKNTPEEMLKLMDRFFKRTKIENGHEIWYFKIE